MWELLGCRALRLDGRRWPPRPLVLKKYPVGYRLIGVWSIFSLALGVVRMEPGEAFGVALRRRRVEARLTQEALALELDMSRVFVVRLESGKMQPSLETLFRLAKGLNCRADELVTETEEVLRMAGWRP